MPASNFVAPGVHPIVNPIVPASRWDLLPGGHRMKCAQILGRNVFPGYENWCASFWNLWEWSSANPAGGVGNWIKPQIDAAKTLGANTIYLSATTGGRPFTLASGVQPSYVQTSTAQYLAHWKQLLDYIRAQGMFLYPCLSGDTDIIINSSYGYIPTTASFITEATLLVRYFTQWADIIPCVDIIDEYVPAWLTANGEVVYRALKGAAPQFKYTFSMGPPSPPPFTPPTYYPTTSMVDFYDVHPYYDMNPADFDPILTYYGLPVVLGQTGEQLQTGTTQRQNRFNRISAAVSNNTGGRHVAGSAIFTMAPTGGGANDWGICDNTITPRSDVSAIFQAMPA